MTSTFFMPSVNIMGAGCLQEAMVALKGNGFRKALIVTDAVLSKLGVAARIQASWPGSRLPRWCLMAPSLTPRWAMCAPGWRSSRLSSATL